MDGPHLRFMELLHNHDEWIAVHRSGRVFSLRAHEIDLDLRDHGAALGLPDADGYRTWNLEAIEVDERRVTLGLSRRLGTVRSTLELIARMPPEEIAADARESRLVAANEIAGAVAEAFPGSRVRGVYVNQPRGRFARLVMEEPAGPVTGVIADLTGGASAESLLTSAVLWRKKLSGRGKALTGRCWILAARGKAAALKRLHACLADGTRERIGLLAYGRGGDGSAVAPVSEISFGELWRENPRPLIGFPQHSTGRLAEGLIAERGPIDNLFSRQGMTFRFRGLAFARTRLLHGREAFWYGVEREKRLLCADNSGELGDLISSLREYRRHDSPNKQHLYYRAAPEAWLESALRRDITKIDPGLVISPVYNQYRTARDRIDLLAITRAGRIVIVEVKTSADPATVYQAVDYWRRIELQRRSGRLAEAGVFAGREIADRPAKVLLVAPATCFPPQTEELVATLRDEIEIRRVELGEDWRNEIRVCGIR